MVLTLAQRARRKLTTWSRFLLSLLYLGQILLSEAGTGEECDRAKRKLIIPDATLQRPPVRAHKDAADRGQKTAFRGGRPVSFRVFCLLFHKHQLLLPQYRVQ